MGKKNLPKAFGDEEENEMPYASRVLINSGHIFEYKISNLDNVELVEDTIQKYFELCRQDKVRLTISGLGMILGGLTRNQLMKIASGQTKSSCQSAIQTALQTIEMFDEQMLKEGLFPALAGIFYFKNNYGYTDKTELVVGAD